jgi:hypothetical protein
MFWVGQQGLMCMCGVLKLSVNDLAEAMQSSMAISTMRVGSGDVALDG